MKYKGIILIAFLGIVMTFASCKKGANDPTFSFSSRDARITADWSLNSMNKSTVEVTKVGETEYTSTTTYVFDETTMTETSDNGFGEQVSTYPYSYEIVVNKDGTYEETEIKDGTKSERTDYWFWANSDKSKIAITFSGIKNKTYMIDRLAKDELVLTQSTVTSNTDTDGKVITENNTVTMTFTKN